MVLVVDHRFPHFAHEHVGRSPYLQIQTHRFFSPSRPKAAPPTHGHVAAAVLPPMDADSWCLVLPWWSESMKIVLADGFTTSGMNLCRYAGRIKLGLVMSALSLELLGAVLKPVVQNRRLGMALYNTASGTKGVTVRWFKKFQGMFEHQISHLQGMPRSSIEHSSKAKSKSHEFIGNQDSKNASAITWSFHSIFVSAQRNLQNIQ